MARSFAEKLAALLGKVPDKFATLHARASDPHRDRFSPCVAGTGCGQLTVGLKNQPEGLPEITPGFGQRPPLRVGAREFHYQCNITLWHFHE